MSVPVAQWVGERLMDPVPYDASADVALAPTAPWPKAAWGRDGDVKRAELSMWPVQEDYHHLDEP